MTESQLTPQSPLKETPNNRPKKSTPKSSDRPPAPPLSQKLGDYAHTVISEQFHALAKQKRSVLADQNPEHLHKMRVATRRLQSALQTFSHSIDLPKAAQLKPVRSLGKALGRLRDLDVQTNAIQEQYYPLLNSPEQEILQTLLKRLQKDRQEAFEEVEITLTRSRYKKLKAAFTDWLNEPQYKAIAQIPLAIAIPDLIHSLLPTLLLHPAWLTSSQPQDLTHSTALHDLRKICKAVRYQSEFFEPFYTPPFQDWISELKTLQESLGKVQDSYVLSKMLQSQKAELPDLQALIQQQQQQALTQWEPTRQKYLSPQYRQHLYQMISTGASSQPDQNN